MTINSGTASITLNGGTGTGVGFPYSGSALITGSLGITGSLSLTGSLPTIASGGYSGSLIGNLGDTDTTVPAAQNIVTLTSASYASLVVANTTNANTLYFITGSVNTSGTAGTSGVSGANGSSGISGTSGANGTSGTSGVTGAAGTSGTSGTTPAGGASFPYTGSAIISGSIIITGSAFGNVVSNSISSNTASIDLSAGNYITCLVSGNMLFNITNPRPGETTNILLTVGQPGPTPPTASFSSNVKQISGSRYFPTSGSGRIDLLSFVSFDSTNVYMANIRNLV